MFNVPCVFLIWQSLTQETKELLKDDLEMLFKSAKVRKLPKSVLNVEEYM